jgi:hypothetical protein
MALHVSRCSQGMLGTTCPFLGGGSAWAASRPSYGLGPFLAHAALYVPVHQAVVCNMLCPCRCDRNLTLGIPVASLQKLLKCAGEAAAGSTGQQQGV